MPEDNKKALARAAIAHVFDANENPGTPAVSGYDPMPPLNLQAMGYNVAIQAEQPASLGYSEMPPLTEPVSTAPSGYDSMPPLNLQAMGYNVAIPAEQPESLGYSATPDRNIPTGYIHDVPDGEPDKGYSQTLSTDDASGEPAYTEVLRTDDPGYVSLRDRGHVPNGEPASSTASGYVDILGNNNSTGPVGPDPATGLRGKQLGAKYVGEEKGEGWRKNRAIEGRQVETEYFSEEKKNQSKVGFDRDGKAFDHGGELDGKKGFVVDPSTGNMHVFTENDNRIERGKILMTHHSSPLSGKPVAGAGMVTFEDGQINNITDQSGHYKPEAEYTFQTVQQIDGSAAKSPLLDDSTRKEATVTLLGKTGMLTDDEYAPLKQAYQSAKSGAVSDIEEKAALEKFKEDVNRVSALKQLQAPMGEAEYARLLLTKQPKPPEETNTPEETQASKETKAPSAIEQAMRARQIEPGSEGAVNRLKAALGAEAVEKIKGDKDEIAKLSQQYGVVAIDDGFADGPELSGFAIGTKSAATLTAQQFLQTGGNEAQIRTKQRMMSEIQPDKKAALTKVTDGPVKQEELRGDLASRKQSLDKKLKKLDAEIAVAEQPDGYTGKVDEAELAWFREKKKALLQEMDALLAETANDELKGKKGGSSANPPDAFAPKTHSAAELTVDDQWMQEQAAAKMEAERLHEEEQRLRKDEQQRKDAERLQFIWAHLGGKVEKWKRNGLTVQEIHKKLHDEEKVSHEDAEKLGFPG